MSREMGREMRKRNTKEESRVTERLNG